MPGQDDGTVVLELRVHGVRGTPPSSMLGVDSDEVVQVAGDRLTGFHRIDEGDPPFRTLPPTMALEAYSWGALTSGVRGVLGWVTRVLWLALLPFALVNLAFWARTRAGQDSGQSRWGVRAVRVSGLVLTVIAVLTPSFIAIDLVAWQCFRANAVACPVLPDWMDVIAGFSAGPRIAVMSLVPLAVVLVLVALSLQSLARYEAAMDQQAPTTLDDAQREAPRSSILEHPLMWSGEMRTRRLQRLHVTAALATIVLFSGTHLLVRADLDRLWPTTIAAALLLVFAFARALVIDELDLEFRDRPHVVVFGREVASPVRPGALMRRVPLTAVAWTAALVLLAHLAVLWTIEVPVDVQDEAWFGSNLWFISLFVGLTLVHVVVFVGGRMAVGWTLAVLLGLVALVAAGAWVVLSEQWGTAGPWVVAGAALIAWVLLLVFHVVQARKPASLPLAWGGAGASVMLGAATMVALLYTSAVTVAAADQLNGDSQSVADLITVRNEKSPVSAQGEPELTLSGDVVLIGARIVRDGDSLRVTDGTIRTEALNRASEGMASYSMASTMVDRARLVLPADATTVQLVGSCFGNADNPDYPTNEACTGESPGFRTAGALAVPASGLQVVAADGRIELEVTDPPQTPLVVPQILVWTPLMQLLLIVIGALVVGLLVLRFRSTAAPQIRDFLDADGVAARDRGQVGSARVSAALAHRAERLLDAVGVVTTVLAVATLSLSSGGRAPWALFPELRPIATIALYTAVLACLVLMLAGAQVRRSATARRTAGIVWDVTTFWPRAGHPFAPPCYAERVVPEITERVEWALGDDPDRVVVLSGHSQGSLICVAVACRLTERERQLRLLTYGSQIRAIYGRVFPAAAGPDQLGYLPTTGVTGMSDAWPDVPGSGTAPIEDFGTSLRDRLDSPHHWINLFRRSDPLGYRVYSDQDGELDVVTPEVKPPWSGDPGSLVMTHGGYQHSPQYRGVISRWTHETLHVPPVGPVEADPLPPD